MCLGVYVGNEAQISLLVHIVSDDFLFLFFVNQIILIHTVFLLRHKNIL